MPDTASISPALDNRALRHLGGEHGVLLEGYHALCRIPPIADKPLGRLIQDDVRPSATARPR